MISRLSSLVLISNQADDKIETCDTELDQFIFKNTPKFDAMWCLLISCLPCIPGISTNSNGYSVGVSAPAPAPSVNAWDKPISFAVSAPTVATIPQESSKFDKGDQHDSGIDVSEPLNSAGSSTRSSPSGEKKIRSEDGTVAKVS